MSDAFEVAVDSHNQHQFSGVKELQEWVTAKLDFWSWLGQQAEPGKQAKSRQWSGLTEIRNLLNNVGDRELNEGEANKVRSLLAPLSKRISDGQQLRSDSPLSAFIESERKANPQLAADIVYLATLPPNSAVNWTLATQRAMVVLSFYQYGISPNATESLRRTLEEVSSAAIAKQSEFDLEARRLADAFEVEVELRADRAQKSSSVLAKFLTSTRANIRQEQIELRGQTKDELAKLTEQSRMELQQIKEFYETEIALLEPISYWSKKKDSHWTGTLITALAFLAYILFGAYLLRQYLVSFPNGLTGFLAFWKEASLGALGAFAGMIALGLAMARILYRLFASQLHLWNDAAERVVMIQTYLSLANKGHAKDEFLGSLLTRLFSPSSDGVVKDDFGAVGPIDLITRQMGSRS